MPHIVFNDTLLSSLSGENAATMRELMVKLSDDKDLCLRVCDFIGGLMSETDRQNFQALSEEVKFQACLEFLIIGLVAGSISKKELVKLM